MKKWIATALGACCLFSALSFVGCGGGGGGGGEAGKLPVDEYYKGEYTAATKVDMETLQGFSAQVSSVQSYKNVLFASMVNNVGLKANVSMKEESVSSQFSINRTMEGTQLATRDNKESTYLTSTDYVIKTRGAKIAQKSYFDGEYNYYYIGGPYPQKMKFSSNCVDAFGFDLAFYNLPYVLDSTRTPNPEGDGVNDADSVLGSPSLTNNDRGFHRVFTVTDAWIDYADETDSTTKVKINYSMTETMYNSSTETWKESMTDGGSYTYVYENGLLVGFRAEGTCVDKRYTFEGNEDDRVTTTTIYTVEVFAWEGELNGLTDEEKKDYLLDGYQGE